MKKTPNFKFFPWGLVLGAWFLGLFFSSCDNTIEGCMDPNSSNYNPNAQKSDGSCSYPSNIKKNVCFFFTDSDNNTCGTFGIPLFDQVKAANPANTFFIAIHPNSTDTLFAPAGIDVTSAFTITGFPDFGVGDQANLLTQSAILNAIQSESAETPQGGIDVSYTTTIDSIIVTIYGKFFTGDTSNYFVTAYVVENNIASTQVGIPGSYNHQEILRAASGPSGIGQQINTVPVSSSTSFKIRSGIAIDSVWNLSNISLVGVLWRKNGSDFEYINAGD